MERVGASANTEDGSSPSPDRITTSSEGGVHIVVFVIQSTTRTDIQPVGPCCCYVLLGTRRFNCDRKYHGRLEETVATFKYFVTRESFLQSVFCIPATSAPVELAISHGGLVMRKHRAKMTDRTLSDLFFVNVQQHRLNVTVDSNYVYISFSCNDA